MSRITFALLGLAGLIQIPAAAQDPFSPGQIWRITAGPSDPWIPSRVSFAGRESLIWASSGGAGGRLLCMDEAGSGVVEPRALDGLTAAGAWEVSSVSGRRGDALFSLVQQPDPDPTQRRTQVHRHDAVAASDGEDFAPVWTHDLGFRSNAPALLTCDLEGDRVVVAAWDGDQARVQVDWLDGSSGALLARRFAAGWSVQGLDCSDDGETVVLTSGLELHVLEPGGKTPLHVVLDGATPAVSISGDGATIAAGQIGAVRSWTETASGQWTENASIQAQSSEVAARLDLSRDASRLAIGWWDYVGQNTLRLEVYDLELGVSRIQFSAGGGGLQDFPEVVRLTPDGRRSLLGSWGDGASSPEVWLFDDASSTPILELSLGGSVQDARLTEDGTRVLVAHKLGHQNVAGSMGAIVLAQSGDRTIDLGGSAIAGRDLCVCTRYEGAQAAFLLVGERVDPVSIPGVVGWLALDRATLQATVKPAVGGRAQFELPVPSEAAWVGTHLALQPAFRAGGSTVLGPEVLEPLVLAR